MPSNRKLRSCKISNLKEVIRNKLLRNLFTFRFDGHSGKGYYIMGERRLTVKQFNDEFPIEPLPVRLKGKDPDTRRI